jgi:heme ABC exporter ATP-binding subunit CcmA
MDTRDDWAIEIKRLKKAFGQRLALRNIDLKVRRGESLVILGPNGAGKTTLIKVLAGLVRPTSGQVNVMGLDLATEAADIRRLLGVVLHQPLLYDDLSGYENLKFHGRMFGVPALESRIEFLVEKVGLSTRIHDRVHTLSRGMQQRLSLARAMLHDPPIVLLDEPETGLDQEARTMLGEIVTAPASARTMIMTTHNLEHGLRMADRIVILAQGKVVYEQPRETLDLTGLEISYRQYAEARR